MNIEVSPLNAEVVKRRDTPGAWGVEAIDIGGDGQCFVTIFAGPQARERAVEYAHVKYASVRVRQ